jgi:hypothetical protein
VRGNRVSGNHVKILRLFPCAFPLHKRRSKEGPPIVDCMLGLLRFSHAITPPLSLVAEYKLHTLQSSPNGGNTYHLLSSNQLHHHMAHLPWAEGLREKPRQLHPLEVDKDLPAENFGEPVSSLLLNKPKATRNGWRKTPYKLS